MAARFLTRRPWRCGLYVLRGYPLDWVNQDANICSLLLLGRGLTIYANQREMDYHIRIANRRRALPPNGIFFAP